MSTYNGRMSENAMKFGLQFYVKKTNKSLIEIVDSFPIDKVRIGFRTYSVNGEAGEKTNGKIDFYLEMPEFELLCHNILTGNFTALVNQGKYPSVYKGSPRDGKLYARVLSFAKGDKGYFITAHEGPGTKTNTGAVMPQFKLGESDHTKVSACLTPEELKTFALMGKRACDHYYLHYFGRE